MRDENMGSFHKKTCQRPREEGLVAKASHSLTTQP